MATGQRAEPQTAKPMDPVCGLRVDTEHPVATSAYGGRTYYFHSAACKAEFDAHPDQFASRADDDASARAAGASHVHAPVAAPEGDRYAEQRASIEATYLEHGTPPEEAHREADAIVQKLHHPRDRA